MSTWTRFKANYYSNTKLGVSLDISRIPFPDTFIASMEPSMQNAFKAMADLEKGAIANPDESRMVGHYWLRTPHLAATPSLESEITKTLTAILDFASHVHSGSISGPKGKFTEVLVIGIGGSALGPQFVAQALGHTSTDKMHMHFFDNTDPDGFDTVLTRLAPKLAHTLVLVISKSGSTPETRNGQLEATHAFKAAGLNPSAHLVAITGAGSKLDQLATKEGWLARFPMWDWVGGRTSEFSAVGLIPAALQGIDINGMLSGAAAMDAETRKSVTQENPAALMALMWHFATDGKGSKDMVVLPYKDRLLLFSRYLQQLVMESLGKELDLKGNVVNQGISVYGNKGSTDQHAYVQQLREGVNNFFMTFIEVLKDREGNSIEVEPGVNAGDFLQGFMLGTRQALSEKNRSSITVTLNEVSPYSVGALIALYERVVGLYASLIGVNAYHQPGVEAGKKAATGILAVKPQLIATLKAHSGKPLTAESLAEVIHADTEVCFKILERLAHNKVISKQDVTPWYNSTYTIQQVS
jgi:glucose-6-phosphate isomerase